MWKNEIHICDVRKKLFCGHSGVKIAYVWEQLNGNMEKVKGHEGRAKNKTKQKNGETAGYVVEFFCFSFCSFLKCDYNNIWGSDISRIF